MKEMRILQALGQAEEAYVAEAAPADMGIGAERDQVWHRKKRTLLLIAAVIAFLGIWGGYTIFVDAFATETSSWLGSITQNLVPFWDMGYQLLGYFLLAGILTGGVGSAFSMRGHLKV